MTMTKPLIEQLCHLPWSDQYGCWVSAWGLIDEANMDMFGPNRDHPAPAADEVRICREWLEQGPPRKTINREHTSYGWKHVIEKERQCYVSNGALLLAAAELGIAGRRDGYRSPNACLAISDRRRNGVI
jgi:hypothetical protein